MAELELADERSWHDRVDRNRPRRTTFRALGARVRARRAAGDIAVFRTEDDEVFALSTAARTRAGRCRRASCSASAWPARCTTGHRAGERQAVAPDEGCTHSHPAKVENGDRVAVGPPEGGAPLSEGQHAGQDHLPVLRRRLRRRRRPRCIGRGHRVAAIPSIRPISAGCARRARRCPTPSASTDALLAACRATDRRRELGRRARPSSPKASPGSSREHGPDAVAFYVSGQLLTEDYYVFNKLAKGFVGTANIDTNSRLCMASSVAGHKRAFGADTLPGCYEDLELADLLFLVGSNTAWCHPVLFQRMMAAKAQNPACSIVVIDPRRTATCEGADLHLPMRPGTDAVLFNGLLACAEDALVRSTAHSCGRSRPARTRRWLPSPTRRSAQTAAICGLAASDVQQFSDWFVKNERVVTLYSQGINQSSSGVDKVNAIINCHLLTGQIGQPGMGPFSLTGQPNAMGGREVGGLANQLAAHMELDNPQHRDIVQRFWHAPVVADRPGSRPSRCSTRSPTAASRRSGSCRPIRWSACPMPTAVRAALDACELVVVSDCLRHTETTRHAPSAAAGADLGREGRHRHQFRAPHLAPACVPAGARRGARRLADHLRRRAADGICRLRLCERLRKSFASTPAFPASRIAARAISTSRRSQRIDDRAYDTLAPVQWPVTPEYPTGAPRLFEAGGFFTPDRKARFVPVAPRAPKNATSRDYPLALNTGRVRDQWHTMTRTAKSPRLMLHTFEPVAEFHPEDAGREGLENGALARLTSAFGAMVARVAVTPEQRRGCVFVPMHWSGEFAGDGAHQCRGQSRDRSDFRTARAEAHAGAGRTVFAEMACLHPEPSRDRGSPQAATGCAGGMERYFRMELAFDERPESWRDWARERLHLDEAEIEWIAYRDPGVGRFRYAAVRDGRLQGCVFIAPDHRLVSRSWLAGLFAENKISANARRSLLTGQPHEAGADIGAIVCSCFGIGQRQISAEILKGARSVEAIGQRLKCGTNCGACKPEIGKLLKGAVAQPEVLRARTA